jgi:hypothetical protein
MPLQKRPRLRPGWVRIALIESAVVIVGALALVALVAVIDDRTRALLPFIAH